MVHLIAFDTEEEELMQLTGLTRDELWDVGFDLDDWDIVFQSDIKLHRELTEEELEDDDYDRGEIIADYDLPAYWLMSQLTNYCVGPSYVEYKGKHYYLAHHS